MTMQKLELLSRLFESVTQIGEPEQAQKSLVHALMEFTGSQGIIVDVPATMATQTLAASYYNHFESDAEAFSTANTYYFWKNPILEYARSSNHSKSYDYHSILGVAAYHDTEYYSDFFNAFGLDNVMNVDLADDRGNLRWGIGLGFEKGNSVSPEIHQLLNSVSQPLCRGLENIFSWSAALRAKNSVDALLGVSNDAVIALNLPGSGNAQLLAASGAAATILDLRTESSKNLHLQELLRLATKAIGANGGQIHWQSRDGRRFSLVAIGSGQTIPNALFVRLVPLACEVDALACTKERAQEMGLTPRQAEVIALMALGLGNREIARKLAMKNSTACVHIQAIYSRLNVSNRVEAVNKLNGQIGNPRPTV